MRPDVVVVVSPECQLTTGVIQRTEDFLIQQLVAQAAIEAFYEAILLGFAGVGVMPIIVVITGPFQDRPACELGPITPSE